MLKPVFVEARDLNECYFELIRQCWKYGVRYDITEGSSKGDFRIEMPVAAGWIHYPHTRPLAPTMPPGVPQTTTDEKIQEYFINYLMDPNLSPNEEYRYSTWINGNFQNPYKGKEESQLDWCINHFKKKGFGNNHCFITVGDPQCNFAYDCKYTNETERRTSPCLRGLDLKIKDNKVILGVIYRSWDLFCISEDSEILTNNGWKTIDTISKETDKAATLNVDNWETEYCDIDRIISYPVSEEMIHLKTKRIDQLITKNHKVLHKYVTHSGSKRIVKDYQYTVAKDLVAKNGSFIPLAAPYEGGSWKLGQDKASLIGWALTDASFHSSCKAVTIYQSEKKYNNEIRHILSRLKMSFTEKLSKKIVFQVDKKSYPEGLEVNMHSFYVPVHEVGWLYDLIPERFPTKKLLDLVKADREALFKAMILADGSTRTSGKYDKKHYTFYSKNIEKLEWFQLLSFSLGYSTIINEKKGYINICDKQESLLQNKHFNGNLPNTTNYTGRVWCIGTKNNNFVMRRNKQISITGNCGWSENMGGFTLLNQFIANELGVEPGPLSFYSQGLHIYGYQVETVREYLHL